MKQYRYGNPLGGRTQIGEVQKFLDFALQSKTDECLIWPFAKTGRGYGTVTRNSVGRGSHVIVCETVHGKKPTSEHQVAHSCANPSCVNPCHLRWATALENAADREAHGHTARGIKLGGRVGEMYRKKHGIG